MPCEQGMHLHHKGFVSGQTSKTRGIVDLPWPGPGSDAHNAGTVPAKSKKKRWHKHVRLPVVVRICSKALAWIKYSQKDTLPASHHNNMGHTDPPMKGT